MQDSVSMNLICITNQRPYSVTLNSNDIRYVITQVFFIHGKQAVQRQYNTLSLKVTESGY